MGPDYYGPPRLPSMQQIHGVYLCIQKQKDERARQFHTHTNTPSEHFVSQEGERHTTVEGKNTGRLPLMQYASWLREGLEARQHAVAATMFPNDHYLLLTTTD